MSGGPSHLETFDYKPELARRTGLGRGSLYKALSSDGNPSFRTVLGVATALGYRFTVRAVS